MGALAEWALGGAEDLCLGGGDKPTQQRGGVKGAGREAEVARKERQLPGVARRGDGAG